MAKTFFFSYRNKPFFLSFAHHTYVSIVDIVKA